MKFLNQPEDPLKAQKQTKQRGRGKKGLVKDALQGSCGDFFQEYDTLGKPIKSKPN